MATVHSLAASRVLGVLAVIGGLLLLTPWPALSRVPSRPLPAPAGKAATGAPAAATAFGTPATAATPAIKGKVPDSPERLAANKALVRRYITEVLSQGRVEELDELVAKSYVDRTPGAPAGGKGPNAVREAQRQMRTLFGDIHYAVQELVAEGDRVAARYVVQATPRVAAGAPPLPSVVINGITFFKIAGGKLQETWIINDQLNMFRQLGFRMAPAAEGESSPPPQPAAPGAASPPPGHRLER
ncbi:MAG: ester cyclase [Acidobacteriota bacterium]|nr:ester cyclase [Acidobacteriota bacterium]